MLMHPVVPPCTAGVEFEGECVVEALGSGPALLPAAKYPTGSNIKVGVPEPVPAAVPA